MAVMHPFGNGAVHSFVLCAPGFVSGGWTLVTENNGERNEALLHYSPTASTALGYKVEYWRHKDFIFNGFQMNNLLKRWNNPDSQADLYLKSGIGAAYGDKGALESKITPAGFTGVAADWENRRFFVSYENRYTEAGPIDDFYMGSGRVGWAPYEGDYGDLHTWLMLQIDHTPENEDHVTVTPLVRLFKSVHLLEAGMNDRGEVLFNYTFRY